MNNEDARLFNTDRSASEARLDDNTGESNAAAGGNDAFEACAAIERYLRREELINRFADWLDETLEQEDPPAGVAGELLAALESEDEDALEEGCDQYAMWSALTALTQEVRIQGRTFKTLADGLGQVQTPDGDALSKDIANGLSAELQEAIRQLRAESFAELEQARAEAKTATRSEALKTLLDMSDRLERGLETAQAMSETAPSPAQTKRPPKWAFWRRRAVPHDAALSRHHEAIEALRQGYQMSLDRLNETLQRWGVHEIPCQNAPFNPKHMRVAEVFETEAVAEGTVTAVIRKGYFWKETPLRIALVQVAKRPTRSTTHD